jgi:hypothetical protein
MTTNEPAEQRPTQRTPATNDFPTGPAIGDPFPDFALPNQRGDVVHLSEARGESRAVVVFERSARW